MDNKFSLAITDELPLEKLGQIFVKSGFFTDSRDASQAIVKILAGREMGFPPIISMQNVNIIKGKVSLSAHLIASKIKSHPRYNYLVNRLDDTGCSVTILEQGTPIGTSTFTHEDAVKAGLANGDNYRRFARNMYFARAISNAAKWFCPDILNGTPIYTPEELGAIVNDEGTVIGVIDGNQVITQTQETQETQVVREWEYPVVEYENAIHMKNSKGVEYGEMGVDELENNVIPALVEKLDKVQDPELQDKLLYKLGCAYAIVNTRPIPETVEETK